MIVEKKELKFKHRIDKSQIPTVSILGVKIASVNMKWIMNFIQKNILFLKGDYITVANVHTTVTAFKDKNYLDIQNGGIMAIPDGGPLATEGKHRGAKGIERTPGPSLMAEIFHLSVANGYKHFFYGSSQDTLNKMKENLLKQYPGLLIVGMYSPPYTNICNATDKEIEIINSAKPDFVWVGLGAPKQEIWMSNNQGKINGLMIGVGAGFDYFAGNIKRAPKIMQKLNLEWLFRLIQNPKLFKRYFITNNIFIWEGIIRKK